jgi:hypothetical protein
MVPSRRTIKTTMIVKMGRWTAKREILIGNPFHCECRNLTTNKHEYS